jgi:hypothetical protein
VGIIFGWTAEQSQQPILLHNFDATDLIYINIALASCG